MDDIQLNVTIQKTMGYWKACVSNLEGAMLDQTISSGPGYWEIGELVGEIINEEIKRQVENEHLDSVDPRMR